MRPDRPTPARLLARREVGTGAIMVDLVRAGDLDGARACRDQLASVSVERAIESAREHAAARRGRSRST